MVASADRVFLSLPGSALVYDLKVASHVAPTPVVDEYMAPSPVPLAKYIAPVPVLAVPEVKFIAQASPIFPVWLHYKICRKLLLDELLPHAATRTPGDSGVNPLGDRPSPWARWRPVALELWEAVLKELEEIEVEKEMEEELHVDLGLGEDSELWETVVIDCEELDDEVNGDEKEKEKVNEMGEELEEAGELEKEKELEKEGELEKEQEQENETELEKEVFQEQEDEPKMGTFTSRSSGCCKG